MRAAGNKRQGDNQGTKALTYMKKDRAGPGGAHISNTTGAIEQTAAGKRQLGKKGASGEGPKTTHHQNFHTWSIPQR